MESKRSLLKQLKLQKYSDKLVDRRKFKKLVIKLENKTQKITSPGIKILTKRGKTCVMSRYLIGKNKKKQFILTTKRIKYLKNKLKKCNFKELVVFLHINNEVTGNKHLNLLIVNLKNKTVSRIDPTDPNFTTITNKKIKKGLNPFFKKLGLTFIGYDHRSKIIKHGKLCRYAGPAEYIYGRRLNHKILKKFIIDYF